MTFPQHQQNPPASTVPSPPQCGQSRVIVPSQTMRIFFDRAFLPDGAAPLIMLGPFLGRPPESPLDPNTGRFDAYAARASALFAPAALDAADVAVYPAEWPEGGDAPLAYALAEHAARVGKRILVFFNADSLERIPIANAIVLRTSLRRSALAANEAAMPAWSEDFVARYCGGTPLLRPYQSKPIVGYCGYSSTAKARLALAASRWLPVYRDSPSLEARAIRGRALASLRRATRHVRTNILQRAQFWNGARLGAPDPSTLLGSRLEYVGNMLTSDYALCMRGAGNFSYRFYEALSLGRIPVLVDTDCVLPFEDSIAWEDYIVRIDHADIPRLGAIIAERHRALGPNGFAERQRACRALWLEWLSPLGFFSQLWRHVAATQSL